MQHIKQNEMSSPSRLLGMTQLIKEILTSEVRRFGMRFQRTELQAAGETQASNILLPCSPEGLPVSCDHVVGITLQSQ